ncbi:MAG: alpha-1,2-fucosyltransferase [Clostridia bacterium]|nr:alpha-1,2-fucosyltransferase [Clostridia bacterium]MBP3650998.1 alpha-1,2-fucosyltransferase [Clostridia bacterium]
MLYAQMMGGLGNQMFIYAFARAFQLRHGGEVTFVVSPGANTHGDALAFREMNVSEDKMHYLQPEEGIWPQKWVDQDMKKSCSPFGINLITRAFRKGAVLWQKVVGNHPDKLATYEKLCQPFLNLMGVACMDTVAPIRVLKPFYCKDFYSWGYFQWEQYFTPYQEIIRSELRLLTPPDEQNARIIQEMTDSNAVCLHIRRGDYFKPGFEQHQVCTIDYYTRAIEMMRQKQTDAHFFVFSDDISWVRENLPMGDAVRTYVDHHNSAVEDLRLMYHCKHFILSNSSFSWWAQYLAENEKKVVIAPEHWYSDGRKTGLYQADWICLQS